MRRKSDREIRRENSFLLITGIVCILCGLFIILQPILPSMSYEDYIEKEVVIREFEYFSGGRYGASYHYIVTADGDEYNLTGNYDASNCFDRLLNGTVAIIKCYSNPILPFIKHAEEITVGGEQVVTYNNDDPIKWAPTVFFCLFFWLAGIGALLLYRWFVIRNRKIQANRDARITRKYGKLKK